MINTFSKLAFIALLTSLLLISGCKKSQPSGASQTAQDPNLVMANEALLAQIKISVVSQGDVSDILRVAGQIDFDEQALTRIGASVTGRVTQINAQLGNEVKKGDTLALINSSELSNSQLAYLKARSNLKEELTDYTPKVRIEIVAPDEVCDSIVDAIVQNAQIGQIGDGLVWVTDIERAVFLYKTVQGDTGR